MLEFRAISKSYSSVRVLREVSFEVPTGCTLGLVGENGAGKSTLMNILGGNLRPDAGQMLLNSQPYAPHNPLEAARHGIAFIHQELNLFPNLSIGENIFLTAFSKIRKLPLIDRRTTRQKSTDLLAQVGLTLSPDTAVERLSAGERQLVEIAKVLSLDARLIILDEPTTSLSVRESETLFALMARLRQRGISMIYISHTLGEVLRLCGQVVVLRDGEVVGTGPRAEFTAERMIALMVGRNLSQLYPIRKTLEERFGPAPSPCPSPPLGDRFPRHADASCAPEPGRDAFHRVPILGPEVTDGVESVPTGFRERAPEERVRETAPALEARHLTQPGIVRDISFALPHGEVLGISGLMGAGRSELARILFGLDPCARGEVRLNGVVMTRTLPRRRIQRGLAFLTENRREEGLCAEATIADNIALVSLRQHARSPLRLLDFASRRRTISAIRQAVRLTPTARDEQPVKILSGGNQQKVVLAKWLLAKPSVLILDEPTRGIDVGAKFELYQLIHQLADQGAGVLVISSELEELIGICDRILVMSHGEIRDELKREEFDRERILRAALGNSPALEK